jgi:uncharacterized protein (UPF0218 family)
VRLVLKQLQAEPAFPNAVPIDLVTTSGTRRIILKPTSKQTIEEIKLNNEPTTVTIDADKTILKDARVNHD